jgi:ribulose-5-phosphate 4-epimerase/fuculose-1-phosphate aldolase
MPDSHTLAETTREMPPVLGIGRRLTVQQELACALRILARAGWQENMTGHVTWVEEGSDNMWCNPWGIWWEETKASDICLVAESGKVTGGKWSVSGAVFIHTELHRVRPDARIAVHGHPYYTTLLAALGVAPRFLHQNSCLFDGEIGFVDEYDGIIGNADAGMCLAKRIGNATGVVLANHGAIVTGATIAEACYRAEIFERMSKFTYEALLAKTPAREIDPAVRATLKPGLMMGCPPIYWDGAVRRLLKLEPDVLD